MTILGGLAIPFGRFGIVLWNALAVGVYYTEVVLRFSITPLGKRKLLPIGSRVITSSIRCDAIIPISPRT